MSAQIIIASSATKLAALSLTSGDILTSFASQSSKGGVAVVSPAHPKGGGLVLSLQDGKGLLLAFAWQKDQVHLKIILPQKLSVITTSDDGIYCAGGTGDGHLYIWEIASGLLLASYDAHYRGISVLKFTKDSAALIAGSDDSGISVWSLPSVFHAQKMNIIPSPVVILADHTLPITDIQCGYGKFPDMILLSSSLDSSCKIWDLASQNPLQLSVSFPQPVQAIILDPLQRFFFAASADKIRLFNLFTSSSAVASGEQGDTIHTEDDGMEISPPEEVSCMALTISGAQLLVGSKEGLIHVYDLPSRQHIRSITYQRGLPILDILCISRPLDLIGHVPMNANGSKSMQNLPPLHSITAFRRAMQPEENSNHVVSLQQKSGANVWDLFGLDEMSGTFHSRASPIAAKVESGVQDDKKVIELASEVMELRQALAKAQSVNEAMWAEIVDEKMENIPKSQKK